MKLGYASNITKAATLLLVAVLFSGYAGAEEKTIAVDHQSFNAVQFNGAATLHISQGTEAALVASGSKELLDNLKVSIHGGTLFIETKENYSFLFNTNSNDILITLVVVDLIELRLKGSTEVLVQSLEAGDLSVDVSGASEVAFEKLVADTLTINAIGANEFNIDGAVESQNVSLKGASDYNAIDLSSETAIILLAGSGDARVQVEAELDVRVYGVGEVAYLGSPKVNQSVRGMGSVKRIKI